MHLSDHTPPCARPVLLTRSLEQVAQRNPEEPTRARNSMLKTDGPNPLSAPPPSERKRQPASLVIPGFRVCGQHARFGLGCSRDWARGEQAGLHPMLHCSSPLLLLAFAPQIPGIIILPSASWPASSWPTHSLTPTSLPPCRPLVFTDRSPGPERCPCCLSVCAPRLSRLETPGGPLAAPTPPTLASICSDTRCVQMK